MPEAQVKLSRALGLRDVTLLGVGAMIGAGIFVLTGIAANVAGPALILVFALNGIVTLFTAMTYAELGSALPNAGGSYLWVKHAMGTLLSFVAGWMSWFAASVAAALYGLGFGSYAWVLLESYTDAFPLLNAVGPKGLSVAITVVFLYINYRGAGETGKAGNLITSIKLAIIALFILAGLFAIFQHPWRIADNFDDFAPLGWTGILAAMGLTFIAFEGYEIIAQAGEEVQNPKRNVPKAIFLSLLIVIPFYILTGIAALGAVTAPGGEASWQFIGSAGELGLLRAAEQFMPFGTIILIAGALVSTMSALNATTFASTRVSFAMGRDRILHGILGHVSKRRRTPDAALSLSGMLMISMVLFVPIQAVAAAADVMFLLLFLQVNYAAIRLRKNWAGKVEYGYKTPFFPLIPILAMSTMGVLSVVLFIFEPFGWLLAFGWIVFGFGIYIVFGKDYKAKEETGSRVVFEERPSEKANYRILVPVSSVVALPSLVEDAVAIANSREAPAIEFVALVTLPRTLPLAEGKRYASSRRDLLDEAERLVGGRVPVRKAIRVGRDEAQDILFTAAEHRANLMILAWEQFEPWRYRGVTIRGALEPSELGYATPLRAVIEGASCDVVLIHFGIEHDLERASSPIGDDWHDPLSIRIGVALAKRRGVKFNAMHILKEASDDEKREEVLREAHEMMDRVVAASEVEPGDVDWTLLPPQDRREAIMGLTSPREILVIGASQHPWYDTYLFGGTADYLAQHATGTVVLVKHFEGVARRKLREAARELARVVRSSAQEAERAAVDDIEMLGAMVRGEAPEGEDQPTGETRTADGAKQGAAAEGGDATGPDAGAGSGTPAGSGEQAGSGTQPGSGSEAGPGAQSGPGTEK